MSLMMREDTFLERIARVVELVQRLEPKTLSYVHDHLLFGLGRLPHGGYVPFNTSYDVLGGSGHWRSFGPEAAPLCLQIPDCALVDGWENSFDEWWPEPDCRALLHPNYFEDAKLKYLDYLHDLHRNVRPMDENTLHSLPFTTGIL